METSHAHISYQPIQRIIHIPLPYKGINSNQNFFSYFQIQAELIFIHTHLHTNKQILSIYLFIRLIPTPATAGLTRIGAKERRGRRAKERKGIEAQKVKYQPHPGQLMHS